jgi:hypothetical protein
VTRSFLRALFEYGAYLVDAGDGFGFFAEDCLTASPNYSASHAKLLLGEHAQFDESKTLWWNIMQELNEWLSWKLAPRLFDDDVKGGPAFACENEAGELLANFRVVEDLQ